jgi:ketopantoate reductase
VTSSKKVLNKLDVKLVESRREVYLKQLDQVIELSLYKYTHKQTKNIERIRWGRLVVQAVQAGASIVKDVDLDEIVKRMTLIEAKLV